MKGGHAVMSIKNLSRIEVLEQVKKKELTQSEASQQLGLSRKQINQLYKKYREQGAGSLASKRHGKASNNRLADEVKQEAMEIVKTHYKDFGPTLAHEKLMERHGLKLSREEDLYQSNKQLPDKSNTMVGQYYKNKKTGNYQPVGPQKIPKENIHDLVQKELNNFKFTAFAIPGPKLLDSRRCEFVIALPIEKNIGLNFNKEIIIYREGEAHIVSLELDHRKSFDLFKNNQLKLSSLFTAILFKILDDSLGDDQIIAECEKYNVRSVFDANQLSVLNFCYSHFEKREKLKAYFLTKKLDKEIAENYEMVFLVIRPINPQLDEVLKEQKPLSMETMLKTKFSQNPQGFCNSLIDLERKGGIEDLDNIIFEQFQMNGGLTANEILSRYTLGNYSLVEKLGSRIGEKNIHYSKLFNNLSEQLIFIDEILKRHLQYLDKEPAIDLQAKKNIYTEWKKIRLEILKIWEDKSGVTIHLQSFLDFLATEMNVVNLHKKESDWFSKQIENLIELLVKKYDLSLPLAVRRSLAP